MGKYIMNISQRQIDLKVGKIENYTPTFPSRIRKSYYHLLDTLLYT